MDGAEIVMLLTEWAEFREADPCAPAALVDVLDTHAYRSAGWTIRALGRPAPAPLETGVVA